MASVQDLETRILVLEDKVNMLLQMISVTKREPSTVMPGEFIETKMNGLDIYRELKHQGASFDGN
jgi:hypothetical protein